MNAAPSVVASVCVAALGVGGSAWAQATCAPGPGGEEACLLVEPQVPQLRYEVATGAGRCSTIVDVHLGAYGTTDCIVTSTTLAFPAVVVPGLAEIMGGAFEIEAGETVCPSNIAVAFTFGGTFFSACLLYDMGSGGEQLGFDAESCSGGTDPRVDVLGFP